MAIREYEFVCDGCDYEFSRFLDWEQISKYKPQCPNCKKKKVYRNYSAEKVLTDDGVPKTVGALADKNSKKKGIKIDGPPPRLEL